MKKMTDNPAELLGTLVSELHDLRLDAREAEHLIHGLHQNVRVAERRAIESTKRIDELAAHIRLIEEQLLLPVMQRIAG